MNSSADKPIIVRKTDGNPEGKGVVGLLRDWDRTAPKDVVAKPPRQLLAEFFTSMVVLSAAFKYRPPVGIENYLYWIDGHWSLSLIAPEQWSAERQAGFAGTCVLLRDMTWSLRPSDNLAGDGAVADAMRRFYEGFADKLQTDVTLEEILPIYERSVPYYQRLHAAALSRSLRMTLTLSKQTALPCRQWAKQLPQLPRLLSA